MATGKIRKKTFNTAGLCFPEKHYMIDPLKRLAEVEKLIEQELYFTLHAPRQTGKTTYLHALARKLNAEGQYIALKTPARKISWSCTITCKHGPKARKNRLSFLSMKSML